MAKVCPNTNSEEWKRLVNEFQGNEMLAMRAFMMNKNDIPEIDSKIVKKIKEESKINFGPEKKDINQDPLNEKDYYELDDGTKINRVGNIIGVTSPVAKPGTDYIIDRANRIWKDKDKETHKIVNNRTGEPESYSEYIKRRQNEALIGRAKGKVLHYIIEAIINPNKLEENEEKVDRILMELQDSQGSLPFSYEWITSYEEREDGSKRYVVVEKILNNLGINTLKEIKDPALHMMKDRIITEVTVINKDIGLGGTIDMMVEHSDGTYSLVDWKTGKAFAGSSEFNDMFLMRFGDQGSKEITNNLRNRAKVQLTLYAMLLKANNPGMRFRDLQIGWIPNEHIAVQKDVDAAVDVNSFLPMMEKILDDKKLLKEWGIDPDIKAKLLAKDKNIFKPSEYSQHSPKNTDFNDILSGRKSPQQVLEDKLSEIRYITGSTLSVDQLSKSDRKRLVKLSNEVSMMLQEGNIVITKDTYHDMNMMEKWLGNYSEVIHPAVQAWKSFKNKREADANKTSREKIMKFRSLLKPVIKEMEKKYNVVNILGNKNFDYDKLYGWMYVKEADPDYDNKSKERLLTNKEMDPELKQRWKELSQAQKRLLLYVNKTFSEYFTTEGRYANMIATQDVDGRDITQLELFNKKKRYEDKIDYYNGFFFKVPMDDEEIIMRAGKGSYVKGLFNKKTLRRMWYENLTMFREREYENWFGDVNAIPMKYMGNDYINTSMDYTRNMEFIFEKAVTEMERMDRMQDVYALGLSLKTKLELEKDPNNPNAPLYENLVKFLDAKLIHDVLNRSTLVKWGRSKRFRVPMYNPKTGRYEETPISVDKVLNALRHWGSAVTMWAKPFRGAGNAVLAAGLAQREAIKGSIAKLKLFGISGDVVDMDAKSMALAYKEYATDVAPKAIAGKIMNSKMYLIAKKLDYLGNNFNLEHLHRESFTKRFKWVNQDILYFPYSMPEEFVSLTTMTATLMRLKNETTGKSLYDSYEKYEILDENGKGTGVYDVRWIGGVRGKVKIGAGASERYETLTELNGREIAQIKKVHERLQGGYRREESLAAEVNAFGKMFVQLKKYFPRILLNGLHQKRIENDLGRYKRIKDENGNDVFFDENGKQIPVYEWIARTTEGRWITIGKYMANLLTLGSMAKEYGWEKLSDEQKTNLLEATITFAEWAMFYGMYLMMFGDTDDDDTSKRLWKQYLVDNLTQQYNFVDLLRTIKTAGTPIAVMKLVDFSMNGTELLFSTGGYILGNDDFALTKNGDLRGYNKFVKTVPLLSSFYDIKNRIKNDKSGVLTSTDWLYGGVRLQ